MQPCTIFLLVHVGSYGWSDQHFFLGTRSATDQYNCDEQCFFEENTKFGVFNCPGNFFSRNFDFAKILQSRKVSLEKVIVRYLSFLVLSYKPPPSLHANSCWASNQTRPSLLDHFFFAKNFLRQNSRLHFIFLNSKVCSRFINILECKMTQKFLGVHMPFRDLGNVR